MLTLSGTRLAQLSGADIALYLVIAVLTLLVIREVLRS